MDDLKFIYLLLEIKYVKANGREVVYGNANDDLYPMDWYLDENYESKIKILEEAIEKKVKIVDTSSYQETIEGIKQSF